MTGIVAGNLPINATLDTIAADAVNGDKRPAHVISGGQMNVSTALVYFLVSSLEQRHPAELNLSMNSAALRSQ
jgi:hypothetical protein